MDMENDQPSENYFNKKIQQNDSLILLIQFLYSSRQIWFLIGIPFHTIRMMKVSNN